MGLPATAKVNNLVSKNDSAKKNNDYYKVRFGVTNSNYLGYKSLKDFARDSDNAVDLENIWALRASMKFPLWKDGFLSADLGQDVNTTYNKAENKDVTSSPIAEVKYRQNFGGTERVKFHLYGRGRATPAPKDAQNKVVTQVRCAFGTDIILDDKCGLYADVHYTSKYNKDKKWENKYGGWVGFNFKKFWIEEQMNFEPGSAKPKFSTNAGFTILF